MPSESPSESPSFSPSASESPSESPSASPSDESLEEEACVLDYAFQPGGTTQYSDYMFNSMVRFGDKYLGACSGGIFELDGDDDNGVDIEAFFEPIITDFGISNPKKVRFVSLGYESDGNLLLTLAADERSEQSHIVDSLKTGQQGRRIPANRIMEGRYIMVRVSNVAGSDFGLDSIDVTLITMPHKR